MLTRFRRMSGRLIRRAGYEIRRQRRTSRLVFPQIPGWFSVEEGELLYLLAAMSPGPILEIGHCLGRSTSAICEGIRDSSRNTRFDSYDLGFRTPDEFVAFYSRLYARGGFDVPPELNELVYSRRATTTEVAGEQLARFGLGGYVNLVSGDFTAAQPTTYDLIFCDAMHDEMEIRQNLPEVVRRSADFCTWAFHDMTPANQAVVRQLAPSATLLTVGDTLGVFRFARRDSTGVAR